MADVRPLMGTGGPHGASGRLCVWLAVVLALIALPASSSTLPMSSSVHTAPPPRNQPPSPPPCPPAFAASVWGRRVAAARPRVCCGLVGLRGGLESREDDVRRVRDGARGMLNDLMQEAMGRADQNLRGGGQGEPQGSQGLKSADPSSYQETSDGDQSPPPQIKVGFVGTGTIVAHTVKGLLRPGLEGARLSVTVSPRSKDKAEELKALFPEQVTIAPDNQAVLDTCDIVCLGVTPQMAETVLSELKFKEGHTVISFLSTAKIPDISRMCAPASTIMRAIPMPPIEAGLGPLVMHPPSKLFDDIFARTGKVIALENESELAAMMSTSALMASYYEWQGAAHKWLVAQGLPSKPATEYVSSLFLALSTKAAHVEDGFDDIVSKSQTPGGINEQVLRNLKSEGWFESVGKQLDAILARVTGKPKA